jgi:hypothetical protein
MYRRFQATPSRFPWSCVCLLTISKLSCESLDDDCKLSSDAKAIFLERILGSFGLRQGDIEIRILKRELKALLCHNTDLEGKMY